MVRTTVVVLLALWALVPVPLEADPPDASSDSAPDDGAPQDSAPEDFRPRVLGLQDELKAHAEPPLEEGPGRVLYKAWKSDLKSRSKRFASKGKELARESLWIIDEDTGAWVAVAPQDPDKWGTAVRRFASLYTELGGGLKNYGKVQISPERALRAWDRKYPEPRYTGLTPAGVTLVRLRRRAAHLRRQGLPVPYSLRRQIDYYVILEHEEIELRREARRRWQADRRAAHARIRAEYAETRVLVEAQRDVLREQMKSLRALVADLQQVEEQRLEVLVAVFPPRDAVHAAGKRFLGLMASGRKKARRFDDERTSRYGLILRQNWLVQRSHLLRAIKSSERSAAKAAEAARAEDAGK